MPERLGRLYVFERSRHHGTGHVAHDMVEPVQSRRRGTADSQPGGAPLGVRRIRLALAVLAGGMFVSGGLLASASADPSYVATVSQKGREFKPNTLSLKRGQSILIVNDDADLLHHAYIDSESFSFDSGDQDPGSKTPLAFTVAGDFKVLCGIHPKMKLLVHVE